MPQLYQVHAAQTLCTAEDITIWGQPLMNRGGHPYDRQHSLDPLWSLPPYRLSSADLRRLPL